MVSRVTRTFNSPKTACRPGCKRITPRKRSDDCESTRRSDRYVDYYTFQVEGTSSRQVQIDLESSDDSYLYLISGDDPSGTSYLERDDNDGPGLDARIIRTLSPGTYTIAATTYDEDDTGYYTLEVSGHR